MNTLQDLLLNELAAISDAERRILRALPKLVKAATCNHLRKALEAHLRETGAQVDKLEKVARTFGVKAKATTSEAMVGLLKDAAEVAASFKGSPALNAALVCAVQKIEHHEIATYGCLHEWAGLLGNSEAAGLLYGILEEEKAANQALIALARTRSNPEALGSVEIVGVKRGESDPRAAVLRRGIRPSLPPRGRTGSTRR